VYVYVYVYVYAYAYVYCMRLCMCMCAVTSCKIRECKLGAQQEGARGLRVKAYVQHEEKNENPVGEQGHNVPWLVSWQGVRYVVVPNGWRWARGVVFPVSGNASITSAGQSDSDNII